LAVNIIKHISTAKFVEIFFKFLQADADCSRESRFLAIKDAIDRFRGFKEFRISVTH